MFSPLYVHAIDPFALQFTDTFGIRWYGLAYLAGFFLGYLAIRSMIARGRSPLPTEKAGDFVFTVALGTVIGGRLGYCLFYNPELFVSLSSSFPFWGVLRINEGGMASHGGIVGIIVACILFARRHQVPVLHLMDLTTLGGTIGVFFGRLANFVNAELVGRPAAPDLPWAVKFPQDILLWPAQAPERLQELAPVVSEIGISSTTWRGWLEALPLHGVAVEQALHRIIAAVQHGNEQITTALAPLLVARHPSQIYQALLEGALLFLVLWWVWRSARKPGVIAGLFLVLYALVRIVGEQFRMPDAHIGFQLLGLTRGQWLSIVMVLPGLLLLWYALRRRTEERY